METRVSKFSVVLVALCVLVVGIHPEVLAAKRNIKPGTIRIISTTIGAEIRLNGDVVAKVPYEEDISVEPGVYQLQMFLRGYMRHDESVTVTSGKVTEVEVDLIAVEGVVLIETGEVMDAIVEVDGQIIGSTPFDGQISAGAHTLRIYKTGYLDTLREIRVQAGKRYVLDFELVADVPVAPVPVAIAPAPGPDFYQTWWFWTLTSVAVAGTVTGVAIGTQEPEVVPAAFDQVISLPPPGGPR